SHKRLPMVSPAILNASLISASGNHAEHINAVVFLQRRTGIAAGTDNVLIEGDHKAHGKRRGIIRQKTQLQQQCQQRARVKPSFMRPSINNATLGEASVRDRGAASDTGNCRGKSTPVCSCCSTAAASK